MRRLLIIGAVLVALWLIFGREDTSPKPQESTPAAEKSQDVSKEEAKSSDSKRRLPQAAEPTPPELVQKVEDAGMAMKDFFKKAKTPLQAPVVVETEEKITAPADALENLPISSRVRVYLYEWGIDLSASDVGSGNIGFEVINNGQFSHHFAIRGVQDFGKILPGEIAVFSAKLGEGKFELYSPRDIDVEKGMKETLSVGK